MVRDCASRKWPRRRSFHISSTVARTTPVLRPEPSPSTWRKSGANDARCSAFANVILFAAKLSDTPGTVRPIDAKSIAAPD